jgi:hypothetical protein
MIGVSPSSTCSGMESARNQEDVHVGSPEATKKAIVSRVARAVADEQHR